MLSNVCLILEAEHCGIHSTHRSRSSMYHGEHGVPDEMGIQNYAFPFYNVCLMEINQLSYVASHLVYE